MAEQQKAIGDFLVVWKNERDKDPEYHIFHAHETKEDKRLYKYCVEEEDGTWICRVCDTKVPTGVVYYGKTRRLNEDNS